MKRIIAHWTAGGYVATGLDKKHYHCITQGDGTEVFGDLPVSANAYPIKGKYAAHTLNCNTDSIGVSMACMRGAAESPLNYGPSPMKRVQWDAFVGRVAKWCIKYEIPVTPKTVLSHAEVQHTLGKKQRGKWDFTVLPPFPELKGAKACGDKLRADVAARIAKIKAV